MSINPSRPAQFIIILFFIFLFGVFPASSVTIVDTRHNLSVTGPGNIKAVSETRVCVFCHTPHNSNPRTPLWNKEVGSWNYSLYVSRSVPNPTQPNAPSRLCLSCHDGTIALGVVLRPWYEIPMNAQIQSGGLSNIGGNFRLDKDHPFSFPYSAALSNPEIYADPPTDLMFYVFQGQPGYIECTTCHDPHEDRFRSWDKNGILTGKFLVSDPRYSGLCLKCHNLPNWIGSAHQSSPLLIDTAKFPVGERTWPTWLTIGEWGCAICHSSHSAPSGQWLLLFPTEAQVCGQCHGDNLMPPPPPDADPHAAGISAQTIGGSGNIEAQTRKISAHRMTAAPDRSASRAPLLSRSVASRNDVTCSDCHGKHVMKSERVLKRDGGIRGSLRGADGVDRKGVRVSTAAYEYEVCFKCHSDYSRRSLFISRVVDTSNTRLAFAPDNASFHPVIERSNRADVPSILFSEQAGLTKSSIIYCTDCHGDDSGTKGVHGSSFAPILKYRYDTADNTSESELAYALCYRCHRRDSILGDASFRKKIDKTTGSGGGHSGHLAAGATCSTCHDPHGVKEDGSSGSHTHLINFDNRVVQRAAGSRVPVYTDKGRFSGSCTLVCHGRIHNDETYPLGLSRMRTGPAVERGERSYQRLR